MVTFSLASTTFHTSRWAYTFSHTYTTTALFTASPHIYSVCRHTAPQWRRNRGFRLFNELGPWAPEGHRVRDQKILRKERIPGEVIYLAENTTKNIKNLGVGSLHRFQTWLQGCSPSRPKAPTSLLAFRASSFSPWGPDKGIEGPQVTVEAGTLRALLRHWSHMINKWYYHETIRDNGMWLNAGF